MKKSVEKKYNSVKVYKKHLFVVIDCSSHFYNKRKGDFNGVRNKKRTYQYVLYFAIAFNAFASFDFLLAAVFL